jgi:Transposase, Mutator family
VVRNGYQPRRELLTSMGPVGVRVPKVRSRIEVRALFRSALVPPYVRRAKAIDAGLPWLYLHGVSTGDMREALAALIGPEAKGLSPPVVARLKQRWSQSTRRGGASRRARIVGCTCELMASALLGAQDGECAELSAEIAAAAGQSQPARHLDGGHQGQCRDRVRALRHQLRRQVPEGD